MGTNPTKAADNIYCKCRKEAAKYNDKLNSREGAAELLGISASTLADYELGITKIIPADAILRMADLYNAPELRNHYCKYRADSFSRNRGHNSSLTVGWQFIEWKHGLGCGRCLYACQDCNGRSGIRGHRGQSSCNAGGAEQSLERRVSRHDCRSYLPRRTVQSNQQRPV